MVLYFHYNEDYLTNSSSWLLKKMYSDFKLINNKVKMFILQWMMRDTILFVGKHLKSLMNRQEVLI